MPAAHRSTFAVYLKSSSSTGNISGAMLDMCAAGVTSHEMLSRNFLQSYMAPEMFLVDEGDVSYNAKVDLPA